MRPIIDVYAICYVLVIDFLAILSPGPDFFTVLRNSLVYSRQAGVLTAFGITIGTVIAFALGLFGVGALVAANHLIFGIIKLIGAVYLAYLGLSAILSKPNRATSLPTVVHSSNDALSTKTFTWSVKMRFVRMGFMCNITNPKALLFIVSLSTYVALHGGMYWNSVLILVGSAINTLIWFSVVSFIFGHMRVRQMFYAKQRLINIAFGVILLYVASVIIFIK